MKDFDLILQDQLTNPDVAREYYRLAPYYRLSEQLILLRKRRGLTQKDLAEKAETTQAVVSRLENISVHASLETIIRMADAMGAAVQLSLVPLEELHDEVATDDKAVNPIVTHTRTYANLPAD